MLKAIHNVETTRRLGLRRQDYRFTRRDVREYTGWSDFQVRKHLQKLVSLEYMIVHRGGRGQTFEYELVYDGQGKDRKPFLIGLIDVKDLPEIPPAPTTTTRNLVQKSGGVVHTDGRFEPPLSPQRAPNERGSSTPSNGGNGSSPKGSSDSTSKTPENADIGRKKNGSSQSYSHGRSDVPPKKRNGS